MLLDQQAPAERDIDRKPSLAKYVGYGSGAGFLYGIQALGQISKNGTAATGLQLLLVCTIGGGLVGLELHRTYHWRGRGQAVNLARWVLAFVISAGTIGSAVVFFGAVPQSEFWLFPALGAVAAVAFFLDFRYHAWLDSSPRPSTNWRRVAAVLTLGLVAIVAAALLL